MILIIMPMKNKGTNNIVEEPKIEEREELDKKLEKIGIQKNSWHCTISWKKFLPFE